MSHFAPRLFDFFSELRENNNKPWFQANKKRFEGEVREPMLRFVEDFAPRLEGISPRFLADARKSGGSVFRIFRDTRFSADKTPYKTNGGIHFRHERARDVHAPGFYLHLSPEEVFVGAGIWHPDSPTLGKIRTALDAEPKGWKDVRLAGPWWLAGDSLKRAPKGYPSEHPLIEDLRRKDFIYCHPLTRKDVCAKGFLDRFESLCREAAPFNRFLTEAVGLEW